ncbi:pyridoxamine 5'-phosphate oxidase family protein [Prauserella flavalba]|uniref:Pyridoxamine 5'-phosphate oxidase N-terminal domain-containing protein n=1 Tax=Prauserella flavalba TaxID=1477506 RepID=A0A318LRX3_9PSEU|nr:pyridoxamine 5'-phosphate oxidase family protein [Prauserella flavalba]PXY36350.1 hypothetical protein BA062_13135 [Prauserella flavalba]
MLPGLDEATSERAERRLRDEHEIWITTVRADGQPQASPVGFLWDGAAFLVLSRPGTPKVRNLTDNAKVALHLDLDRESEDGSVLTLEGVALLDAEPLGTDESAAYVDKYRDVIQGAGLTEEELFAEFSSVVRVRPTRVRFH